ncbi:BLOC-3 complex member HPS1-like [Ornithodoros turicata]|uniref:BLOC-3 complex member HPS1-like n=1 Tax=Ornithodoros turicata TaxID=34597 RepID=UPI0031394609
MRGFIIFDSVNDVVFRQLDGELLKHVFGLALKNELVPEHEDELADLDAAITNDVLVQLFSPLVTSHRMMKEKMNMYSSIYCKDQTLCVFAEFLGHTLLGINSEKEDAEPVARKRLRVFLNLVQRLYGPALHALKVHSLNTNRRAVLLKKLMDTYDALSQKDQSFLVEALEHIVVKSDVRKSCSRLLEDISEIFQRYCRVGEMVSHGFLFVKDKLVATFFSRNSTLPSHADLLVLSLTVRTLREAEASNEQYLGEGQEEPEDESEVQNSEQRLEQEGNQEQSQGQESNQEQNRDESQDQERTSRPARLGHLLMFFATNLRSAMPYLVHWLKIDDDVTVAITSEFNRALLADSLFSLMKQLHSIRQSPEEGRSRLTIDTLEAAIMRTIDTSGRLDLKKDQEARINLVDKKWMHLKMSGFGEYLAGTQNTELAARSEEAIVLLNKTFQLIFEELVLNPGIQHEVEPRPRLKTYMHYFAALVKKEMEDFREMLLTKTDPTLNIGSDILENYPGLLHYIHTNRSANQMVSPSLLEYKAGSLHDKVWKAWGFIQKHAHEGSFTTLWSEDDLQYSYLLWFTNHSGKTVKPKCAVDPMSLNQMYYPGIMAGNFYGQLMRYCFPDVSLDQLVCLEIFCIHASTIAASDVIDQVHQLSTALWHVWDNTSMDSA